MYKDESEYAGSSASIATYDEDYNLVDVARFNSGWVGVDSAGDRYLRLTNYSDYAQVDDFVSIDFGTILAKRSDDPAEHWTVHAGAADALISDQKGALAILTPSDQLPVYVGSGESKRDLTSPKGTDISYLVRLSDTDGSPVSVVPAFTVVSGEIDHPECVRNLYECTDEILSFDEAAAYREVPNEPLYLYNLAWRQAAAWVDESCLVLCELGETCAIKAQCTQDNGVTVDFTIQRASPQRALHVLHVQSENADTGWRDLFLSFDREIQYDMGRVSDDSSEYQIEWTGRWFDRLPENGTMAFSSGTSEDPEGMFAGSSYSLAADTCEISSFKGTRYSGQTGSATVWVNGNKYTAQDTVHPPVYGYINDECIGEIDSSTWEIIGPCIE